MVHFSLSSVFMTVVVSNLLLVLISLCLRNMNLLEKIGYKLMAVFCIVTLMRFMLPFEMPFAKSIYLPVGISDVIVVVRRKYEPFPSVRLSVWNVFCAVWILGSIVFILLHIARYRKMNKIALRHGKFVTKQEPYASILAGLCEEKQRSRVRLYLTPLTNVPMITGLLHPTILLPQNFDPSDKDILFALRHELAHYRFHDLWLKAIVSLFAAVYWWNPFSHLLNKQVSMLMEMRVDNAIASEGEDVLIDYATSLVRYAVNANEKMKSSQSLGLFASKKGSLLCRLQMMGDGNSKKNRLVGIGMLLLVISVYVGSYLVIIENSSYTPVLEESDNYIIPAKDNCYAISNADGTYNVYLNGMHIDTTDSLSYYPDAIVYSSEEKVQ